MRATCPAHLTLLDITVLITLMQNTNYEALHHLSIASFVCLVFLHILSPLFFNCCPLFVLQVQLCLNIHLVFGFL